MSGIYVHIPFCASKCAYCDFFSTPRTETLGRIVSAIGREFTMRRQEIPRCDSPDTIYIGGGTPSLLSPGEFTCLASLLPVHPGIAEFTVEANPDDVTPALVAAWRAVGVNRVSMGMQTFNHQILTDIGRRHTPEQARRAVSILRDGGIGNISLDLIYGLPGQNYDIWRSDLDALLELAPEHFSAYLLSYEPGTRLYARLISGKVSEASDDLVYRMYDHLCVTARAAGYEHYEISNFALPGLRSRHNSSYWDFTPYLGLGPAAHSFDGKLRRVNPLNINKYLEHIESDRPAFTIDEETPVDRINDRIFTAMRTARGLDMSLLPDSARDTVLAAACSLIDAARRAGSPAPLHIDGAHLSIPESHFLTSDAIIRTLLMDSEVEA